MAEQQQLGLPAEEPDTVLEEADVYKATTASEYVVLRRVRLYRSHFVTFHNIDETEDDNKQWLLSAHCTLQPRNASDITQPVNKRVRPRGQWAITTLVKPKAVGQKGHAVQLYIFTLEWPTKWAAKGYTSFTFGFTDDVTARHWHAKLANCVESIRMVKNSAALAASANSQGRGTPASAAAAAAAAAAASAGGAPGSTPGKLSGLLSKSASLQHQPPQGPPSASKRSALAEMASAPLSVDSLQAQAAPAVKDARHRRSATAMSDPASLPPLRDSSGGPRAALSLPGKRLSIGSAAASPSAAPPADGGAAAAAGATAPDSPAPPTRHLSGSGATPAAPPPPPLGTAAVMMAAAARESGYSLGSSDSDEDEMPGSRRRGPGGGGGGGGGPGGAGCRPTRGMTRADVRHTMQRWVPYKQANGVAIYHRRQTAGDVEAGMGGEFMVSTVIRGSPRRCLEALTSCAGNTSILGPALRQEVLQRRRASDEREVQRITLQAPGLAGLLCAPREVVVETFVKTDETGPTLVLMFNSCEPPARIVERGTGGGGGGGGSGAAAAAAAQGQEEAEAEEQLRAYEASAEGVRSSLWRRPVAARVRGGYTMAPLEEFSLDASPEALVTCIIKVDLGGVCGERSWLHLPAFALGWVDAFLDRMLMACTLLRDEVEQARFVQQPQTLVASVGVKERDAGASAADLSRLDPGSAGSLTLGASGGALSARRHGPGRLATAFLGGGSVTAGAAAAHEAGGAASPRAGGRPRGFDLLVAAATGSSRHAATDGAPAGGEGAAAAAAAAEPYGIVGDGGADAGSSGVGGGEGGEKQYETMEQVLERMRRLACLDPAVWEGLHQPGKDAPFKVRGPTYLKDRKKIPAGNTRFRLGAMDVIQQPHGLTVPHEHVARFLPSVRESGAPFSLIIHLVIPGTPLLGIVATFVTDCHPSQLGPPPAQPMEDEHDWEPFDFVLHKYMTGSTHTRNHMLKLIPHIADGSWMIKQSVGTTPVILGKQLRTIYYETPQYLEIDIDISANNVASYVTGLVRGATRSLVIDMGFVLEGTTPWELPEALLGTLRLYNLDVRNAVPLDVSREIPLRPPTLPPYGSGGGGAGGGGGDGSA